MKTKTKGTIMMVWCVVLWSTIGIAMKYLNCNSFFISGFRAIFSVAILAFSMKIGGEKIKITKRCICSAITGFIYINSFLLANKLTTAANAIALQYTSPFFILLISWVVFKRRPNKYESYSVFFCLAGIVLFFFDEMTVDGLKGNLLAILSGFFMAIMYVINGRTKDDNERMTAILLCHSLLLVIGLPVGMALNSCHVTTREIALLAFLGLFQMGLPYILYGKASAIISPVACSLIGMIEPILNPIWVAFFYKEVPTFYAILGAFIIVSTVTIYSVVDAKKL